MNSGEWCPCVNKTPSPTHTDLTTTQPESSTDGGKEEVMYPQIPHIHTPNPYRQDTQTPLTSYNIDKNCIQTDCQSQTKSQTARSQTVSDMYGHLHPHTHGSADRETKLAVSHIDRGTRVKTHTNSFLGLEAWCVR